MPGKLLIKFMIQIYKFVTSNRKTGHEEKIRLLRGISDEKYRKQKEDGKIR
jgi:3-hydroxymyristoyl/3-hydroxydecanoyl-(acyl carrier protein) dehydratase